MTEVVRMNYVDKLIELVEADYDEILYGSGDGLNLKGIHALHSPKPARLPEVLTRQLKRQGVRLYHKGRAL